MTIVIVGGGFAGFSAKGGKKEEEKIVLVDRKDYFLLTPWVIDYVCGLRDDVTIKYRDVIVGELSKVDFKEKKVYLSDGKALNYDKLILTIGHHQNLPRLKGAREFAHKIETFEDATALKKRLEEVNDVVIVGGGATGVELAGNIKGKNITLIQRRDRLLPTMTTASAKKAQKLLEEKGVNLLLGVEAVEVQKDKVITTHGEVKSELTIFAGGLKGPEIINSLHKNRNHRMLVDKFLRSIDYKDVYAAGDCATFENSEIPMSADVAVQAGRVAIKNTLGEEEEFIPKRTATILRIGDEYFGDFGENYVEGNFAKLLKGIAYVESRMLPKE
ncbi:FAD-dependent oxidoreductase [Acidianus sp. HS-5]|uniref:NAD(P)/FAD-dependent oxidoreductase n=1 Tax=Acidianus sp. HS-5 TaxID=2886040 RepID=UPI001F182EE3|nr:FAD-dependent oxidoreductase [Acidianus sp. HS-5]BDC17599.1 FAD-dependent oxidoreductase [Acidianus sp. HS-5]